MLTHCTALARKCLVHKRPSVQASCAQCVRRGALMHCLSAALDTPQQCTRQARSTAEGPACSASANLHVGTRAGGTARALQCTRVRLPRSQRFWKQKHAHQSSLPASLVICVVFLSGLVLSAGRLRAQPPRPAQWPARPCSPPPVARRRRLRQAQAPAATRPWRRRPSAYVGGWASPAALLRLPRAARCPR